ncbi:Ca2+:H+ antiporter [Curtobacterium luteum]|uniref:Ca2+:H+ antiporter n=1 Tax=Curtobacterium luteum TaxID=33881 RepID=A0ABS2RVQ0_9MICO|nr:ionic transporter y4hA [Curtobacterium luteum]MBM7802537.1 Ca2+:H+ antiporter [Curtobacterium luteum]NUU50338.1 ionic transporter y4hA [Curtobacterium luteum]NUU50345.1 ionic transporter y4hA [Curtobacterium luteum]
MTSWIGKAWPVGVPIVAAVVLALSFGRHDLGTVVVVLVAVVLAATVLAAVHHAEVVAHRVGEPFGSLVLAVAVTIIEVALIIALSSSGGAKAETLARDTVFSAVMITMNGLVGLAILIGTIRHHTVRFNQEGASAATMTVAALAVLTLVLPTFTTGTDNASFTGVQLVFVAIASLALYGLFVFTQTIAHRDFFLPVGRGSAGSGPAGSGPAGSGPAGHGSAAGPASVPNETAHAATPTGRQTLVSLGLLLLALVAVVGLAKVESPAIEAGVAAVGFPPSFVGVVIALLILLPEGIAASKAAARDRIQTSLNLAMGSAMASIGLTIPSIAVASLFMPGTLLLGLGSAQIVLLALTIVAAVLTVLPGRATRLQGGVHLVVFAAFIVLSIAP